MFKSKFEFIFFFEDEVNSIIQIQKGWNKIHKCKTKSTIFQKKKKKKKIWREKKK